MCMDFKHYVASVKCCNKQVQNRHYDVYSNVRGELRCSNSNIIPTCVCAVAQLLLNLPCIYYPQTPHLKEVFYRRKEFFFSPKTGLSTQYNGTNILEIVAQWPEKTEKRSCFIRLVPIRDQIVCQRLKGWLAIVFFYTDIKAILTNLL